MYQYINLSAGVLCEGRDAKNMCQRWTYVDVTLVRNIKIIIINGLLGHQL